MTSPAPKREAAPFGDHEVRLNARQWLIAGLLLVLVLWSVPWLWERIEPFDTGPDYRLPYSLSKDYWLYGRRLRHARGTDQIVMLGDSVVWGEYVLPEGTWTHFLNLEAGATNHFVNAGVNGFFPLALEGLINGYGTALRHQKVMVQCNVLWMTSPKADLSTDKEEPFNHSRLVPQFSPRIPCYRADANERIAAVLERNLPFAGWVNHCQNAYFDQQNIPQWTLAESGGDPPAYPNAWKNPLTQFTLKLPAAPSPDPQRGPQSPRHKPWSTNSAGATRFEWVNLDASLQWGAFQRLLQVLRDRGNTVLVVLGPFNEHMMAQENRAVYRDLKDKIALWLKQEKFPLVVPETLPSNLYADASHPLTEGYALLAKEVYHNADFEKWSRP
jgi:hypothetical protein